jgi:hypothetical protein
MDEELDWHARWGTDRGGARGRVHSQNSSMIMEHRHGRSRDVGEADQPSFVMRVANKNGL